MSAGLATPVALIIFNRPKTTGRVFAEIARARPTRLLVVADGPRPDRAGERKDCLTARAVVDQVDWPCEVLTDFAETNLGCKRRVASGLDWVFDQVEEAIILEDDCLPHPSFFPFCEELLERYRDDERVAAIGGSNLLSGWSKDSQSYHFSLLGGIWGWASWRRAWRYYDLEIKSWPKVLRAQVIDGLFPNPRHAAFWKDMMQQVYDQQIDTWDFQWLLACWLQNGWRIVPRVNLVSNIGVGPDATHHHHDVNIPFANQPAEEIVFPLEHPTFMTHSYGLDEALSDKYYSVKVDSIFGRLRRRMATLLAV